jgi:hypothetical protein
MAGLDMPQNVEAAAVGHVDVEQDQVPFLFAELVEGLAAGGGLSDGVDGRVGLQELFESGADHGMVVGD